VIRSLKGIKLSVILFEMLMRILQEVDEATLVWLQDDSSRKGPTPHGAGPFC
jgi:hypothetical protein